MAARLEALCTIKFGLGRAEFRVRVAIAEIISPKQALGFGGCAGFGGRGWRPGENALQERGLRMSEVRQPH